jgi:glycosyltransferase involved in cell wall biosynthesis
MIATRVGGIPEIFGAAADRLVAPGNAEALAVAMSEVKASPASARDAAARLREEIRPQFSVSAMASSIEAVYRSMLVPRR